MPLGRLQPAKGGQKAVQRRKQARITAFRGVDPAGDGQKAVQGRKQARITAFRESRSGPSMPKGSELRKMDLKTLSLGRP